ncbi:hypothetical protein SY27_09150 [Flavobacterium sp. 316]|uniref:T9SS type B sorting domain-containing protein n=1 Tax=Flavobacterium sp. 316 TaxID=1603293 RepID=UPI0005E329EB|nr:T9SS type B sorting domain-containing protein [Flavobacterium sp. 316]KIX20941.1 hypothetical protein SY27_09150 [Flavobacterium sp. 316]
MKKHYYLLLIIHLSFFSFSQNLPNDCQNYIQACDNQNISYNVSGAGVQEIIPESCSSSEHNSLWLRVTIDQPGTLGFTIAPQSTDINEDYDFWVFGPVSDCSNLGTPIRCSTTNPAAAGQTNNHTGLNASSIDINEGPGADGNGFVRQLTALSGQSYFIVIDRPIGNSPFSLTWTGTATILNPFKNINFPDYPDVVLCDEGLDNLELYDFSVLDNTILTGLTDFFITYHNSLQDASLNNNPIIGAANLNEGTYYARISSLTAQCTEIKTVNLIFDNISTNDVIETVCENTAANTIDYDLSNSNNSIYTGTQVVTYKYFTNLTDANNNANEITNWQNRTLSLGSHEFYVRTEKGTCFDTSKLIINVIQRPVINPIVELKQCDDDTDGFSAFNLTEAEDLIVANSTGLTISYFLNLTDAQDNINTITNVTSFVNQTINTQTIYYRVTNTNDCFRVGQLDLIVSATQIPTTFSPIVITSCDDTFGTNNDGIATFDFSGTQTVIAGLFTGQVVNVTFYENVQDALAEVNQIDIANASAYTNDNSPNTQDIYVRVDSDLNNDCVGLGKYVSLQVENHPIVPPKEIRGCDDDNDGIIDFITTDIETELLNGLTNVSVTYIDANNVVYDDLPNPFTTASQIMTVTLKNDTAKECLFVTTLEFIVDNKPTANPIQPDLLVKCDDDEINPLQQNGKFNFDTSTFDNIIKGTQTRVVIEYYDENNDLLPSPLPNPFEIGTQDITVKVINEDNNDCYDTIVLSFIVNPVPNIYIEGEEEIICTDDPSDSQVLNAGLVDETTIDDYTYQWYFNNQIIVGADQYNLTVTNSGNYSVDVIDNNLCSSTRNIVVNPSNIAVINNIEIVDLVDSNTITVLVTGDGNYQYSLDGENYQESNVFYDVQAGLKTVYVYDLNGCGITSETVSVLSVPKYFTPNGDGINDFWNVKGFNERFQESTLISIFDRYGKLLKQISSFSQGWDGTFNTVNMPSSDYWYSIELLDGRVKKGHFSLIR